jgi:rhodanese-related sulfurtransferase
VDDAPRTLEQLLREAEARIERLSPAAALSAAKTGALIVDIRSEASRARDGIVPGAIHIPRTVLEWRFEPGGRWRNPHLGGVERQMIVLCDHGYSSPLAAAALARLGYAKAGDVIGGFDAWRDAGLPTRPPSPGTPEGLPGMAGPD